MAGNGRLYSGVERSMGLRPTRAIVMQRWNQHLGRIFVPSGGRGQARALAVLLAFLAALIATVGQAAAQDWTLTKTANPTTYTAAGQLITYTYVVTNTRGDGTLTSLTDDKVTGISCPTTSIPVNTSLTCTGSYTTTAADVTAGSVTNNATASGDACNDGCLRTATAQATITLVAQPAWTLTNAPSPTTYTAAGQVISYSYMLTNTGNVTIGSITLTDVSVAPANNKPAGTPTCPATFLAAGAGMTCTGSYTTTAADVTAGSVTNTATATGIPAGGALQPVTAQSKINAIKPAAGSITLIKTATGGDNTFSFAATLPGAASFSLTTVNGTASRTFASVAPGTYTVTEVNLPREWKLSGLTCAGNTGGGSTTIDVANRSVAITLTVGEAITCTFANAFDVDEHRAKTERVIGRFLKHRNELLATHEPDRSRFIRRVPGSLWGEGSAARDTGAGGAVAMSGSDGDSTSRFSFVASLSQIARARANPASREGDDEQAMGLGARPKVPKATAAPVRSFDVWVEGHFSDYRDKLTGVRSSGHFGIVYMGADYLLTPAILIGALVQLDWTGERASLPDSSVDGQGYMAGPYVSVKLTPHLFFDARAAWGSSDNSVKPFGTYEDAFTTDRWLAQARLTGNWRFGNFRVTPSLGYTFVEEKQHSYVDTLGVLIPSQTVSLGRLSFGPEIAYRVLRADGTIWEPLVSLQGVWDDTNSKGAVGGLTASGDDFRAIVQAGVLVRSLGGLSLRAVGSYDGLGSRTGYRDAGGQLWLNVPLN